jgi:hypothetical protein
MATLKQKRTIKALLENDGKSVSQAMKDAGYSKASAKNPQRLTRSKTWAELMEKHFPDDLLSKVIEEGLQANRVISANVVVKSDDPKVKSKQATARDMDFIDVPDHAVRHKFAETALKLKNKFPATKQDITTNGNDITPVLVKFINNADDRDTK